ncbi:11638_t:CDS:2 [Acaulospora colombiana]|uniref:11638_t:CDS:1 n=1 Tax=Acaulospora colombiana TaxID=27376 RepID=A0ACA9NAX2_9GLOM|nr:11638_t:CDS:2 [Acaulospora colombiana]
MTGEEAKGQKGRQGGQNNARRNERRAKERETHVKEGDANTSKHATSENAFDTCTGAFSVTDASGEPLPFPVVVELVLLLSDMRVEAA